MGAAGACLAAAGASVAHADEAARPDTSKDETTTVQSLVVTGRRPTLGVLTQKIQNTPQSIDILPAAVLHEQGVASLQDALKNVPGVTLNSGEGGSHGDTINLRGFPAADDFFVDGLRDTGFYTRDSFDVDAIEVYKGPASTLFGRGSTGGVINQVSKTPNLRPSAAASVTGGTNDEVRGTVDINAPINDWAAFRLNAMGERANVTDRDFVLNRRWGVAPSLALGIDKPTSLVLTYLHQEENDIPDYGIPFVGTRPAPVPRQTYYGLPADDRFQTRVDVATARFVHDFSDDLSFTETARYGNYWFNSRETAPHYDPAKTGAIPPPTDATPLDQILIWRDRPSVEGTVSTAMSQSEVSYKFATGPFAHTLVAGVELDREDANLVRFVNQISNGLSVPVNGDTATLVGPTTLLNPDTNQPFPGTQTKVSQRPVTTTDTVSGFLIDSIDFGSHWNLVAGVRFDRFHADFVEPITVKHFDRTDDIPSPRAALVYKPTETQSYYVSYGTSYDPSAESLTLAASNAGLAPERDQTFEVGGKVLVLDRHISLTGAVFHTQMTNARITDPTNPTLQTLAGKLNVDGAEIGAIGYLTEKWEVLANYIYLNGTSDGLVKSAAGVNLTEPLLNTAHHQANLWTTYELFEPLEVGLGVNYLGERTADVAGIAHIPAYVTLDAMASFKLTPQLKLQVNAFNLTNAYYFLNSYDTSPTENHVVPGPGRTVTFTLAAAF